MIDRAAVDFLGRGQLLDDAAVHDRNTISKRQRLDLIVGDVDHRRAKTIVQLFQLDAELGPELGIEVRQRLVEQEDVDIADEGAADGDALALAAGKFERAALHQRSDLKKIGCCLDAPLDFVLRHSRSSEAKRQIPLDRHARIERVGLEHHAYVTVLRLLPGNIVAGDEYLAVADVEEPGDRIQEGGLAAARRTQKDKELALLHVNIEFLKDRYAAEPD